MYASQLLTTPSAVLSKQPIMKYCFSPWTSVSSKGNRKLKEIENNFKDNFCIQNQSRFFIIFKKILRFSDVDSISDNSIEQIVELFDGTKFIEILVVVETE